MTTKTTINRSQFEISISTDPSDFGYGGGKPAPTSAELMARIGVDKRGTVNVVSKYLSGQAQKLGGAVYRVVIREVATDEFWTQSEFGAFADEQKAMSELRKFG